jgi:hypothetical protein
VPVAAASVARDVEEFLEKISPSPSDAVVNLPGYFLVAKYFPQTGIF